MVSDPGTRFDSDNPYAAPRESGPAETPPGFVDDGLPLQPWRTMWTAPRQTIRRIVSRNPQYGVLGLLCLNGIGQSIGRASQRNAGDVMALPALAATVLIGGTLGGVFGGWLVALLLRLSGRLLGGRADRSNLMAALAWAAVPTVAGLALWIPLLAVTGTDMFTEATPRLDASPAAGIVVLVAFVIQLVLAIWSFVLLCNTVAEVQGFRSAWAGLGNLLLMVLMMVGGILAVAGIAVGVSILTRP